MPTHHRTTRSPLFASLFFLSALLTAALLTGCAANSTTGSSVVAVPAMVTGNWQFSSSATPAVRLPAISGVLSGASTAVTGILHSQTASACIAPANSFEVSGSAGKNGLMTLTGPLSGGTLTISGTLSADGKSLTGASYNVTGGSCGFAKAAIATAQAYMPISGTYTGSFTDADGQIATVTATLNQSADANGDGNFTLTGTATPANNPCFVGTIPISATQVTGQTFTFTYTDPNTTNSVTATGTFSSDASTLTIQPWTSSGPCGADSGIGSMTRQ